MNLVKLLQNQLNEIRFTEKEGMLIFILCRTFIRFVCGGHESVPVGPVIVAFHFEIYPHIYNLAMFFMGCF